jgi:hypothetical protein
MTHLIVLEVARPPDEVFSYVSDPLRFAEWQADAIGGSTEASRPLGVGSRFSTIRRIGRLKPTATSEITELSPPSHWAYHDVDGPIRAIANVTVEPLSDGAWSRVTIAVDYEGHGIGKLLVPLVVRPLAWKDTATNRRNLKAKLESCASPMALLPR